MHDSWTKDQIRGLGPRARSPFFELQEKIFKFGTCHFKIIPKHIKAVFRENFNSRRFDSDKIFKIIIFARGPRNTYCTTTTDTLQLQVSAL